MRMPMRVLTAVAIAPAMLASSVFAIMALSLLPPALGVVGFLSAGVVLAALAMGRLKDPAVRVLASARPASHGERQVLAPVLILLASRGVEPGRLYVRRSSRPTMPAVVVGGHSLVVIPWLIEAVYRGAIGDDEAAALIGHAVGRRQLRSPRFELAMMAALSPWRALVALCRGVGAGFLWFPLVLPAWRVRGVVGVVCVIQSALEGRAVYGVLGGAFVALTYLMPAAERAIQRQTEAACDRFLVDHELGDTLAHLLRRHGQSTSIERMQRLELKRHPAPQVRRRLVKT